MNQEIKDILTRMPQTPKVQVALAYMTNPDSGTMIGNMLSMYLECEHPYLHEEYCYNMVSIGDYWDAFGLCTPKPKHPGIEVSTYAYFKQYCAKQEKLYRGWIAALRSLADVPEMYPSYASLRHDAETWAEIKTEMAEKLGPFLKNE